jgi:hypothetical protein
MADGKESGGGLHGFPPEGKMFTLSEFAGLNTRSPRMAIEDQEMSWCENMFPIANGNLRSLYGVGPSIYTATGGKTIVYHFFYNIGSTQYAFVCLSDGTAVQVNVVTHAVTTISSVANTFYNGTSFPSCSQWGNQFLLIVSNTSSNGYYLWDGALLYTSGTLGPQITVTNGGAGYSSAPAITFSGGSGSGAAATAVLNGNTVTSITVTNPGTGYVFGDKVQLLFGGTATAGTVTSIAVLNGGSNYTSAPNVTVSGGGGSSFTATSVMVGGSVTSVTITNGGTGFTSTPTVVFSGGGPGSGAVGAATVSTVAAASAYIMPFGVSGTGIETYQSRVWIINGTKLLVTDPGTNTNFNTVATSTDSFLKNSFIGIKQSNGFLYVVGDSSVNAISNPQTTGTPSITTFNNQNVDPQIGTPWPNSVAAFGRDIIFANSNGIYVMFGGAAEKVSMPLDGIFAFATLPLSGVSQIPCSALHTIFGIKTFMMLMTCVDPFTGTSSPKLMMWDGKKWFIGSQEKTLTYISTQEVSSDLQPWGTDGSTLFPMFYQPSAALAKKLQGKLWTGESYLVDKQLLRVYTEGYDNSGSGYTLNLTVDTDSAITSSTSVNSGGAITFTNNTGGTITFTSSFGALSFTVPGVSIIGQNIDSVYGKLLGFSFTSSSKDFTIVNMSILYKNYRFYG